MRNILLEKSSAKCGGETIPKPFFKKIKIYKLTNLQIISLKSYTACYTVIQFVLLLYAKPRTIEIYRKQAADHLLLPYIKLFKKTKGGLKLVSLLIFSMIFEEKYFSCYILLPDQNLLPGCLLLREILDNRRIAIVC